MPDRLIFTLSRVHSRLTSHFRRELKKEGIDLSPGQIGILFVLAKVKQTTMGHLSQILEIDNAAITRLVDKLDKKKMTERCIDPDDRRKMLLTITAEGMQKALIVKKMAQAANRRIKEGFTEEEIAIYKRVTQAIIEKFNSQ